jgi:hypothetical protein
MSEADYDQRYAEQVSKADRESRHRRAVAKVAEPLLEGMPQTGTHHFPPEQFRALAQYLFEGEPQKLARALKRDRFKLLELEFVCRRGGGELITISDFAKNRGVPRRTIVDRAAKAGLVSKTSGLRKLYETVELNALLAERSG